MQSFKDVEYINDFAKIIERGVYTSPILVVNDKVLLKGSGHSREVIRSALTSLVITEKEKKIADCPYCLST
jgi:predicted DsbA family dithiol-disulfide isomerase